MNSYETDPSKAHSVSEMQEVARNQMRFHAMQLQERTEAIFKAIKSVEAVRDWDSYLKLAKTIDNDVNEFSALSLLGEFYAQMKDPDGGYF